MKYINKMAKHSMLYAVYILDPRHRMSSIKALMPNKIDEIHAAASGFLIKEWPELGVTIATASTLLSSMNIRPPGLSIAQWKALQNKQARIVEAGESAPTSELKRWLASPPIDINADIFKNPDFIQK